MIDAKDTHSTRPYLIRALYEWCTDSGFTPFIAVAVDDSVSVPVEYVKNGEIVLNVSFDATSALKLGNEFVEFKGRFGGMARDIIVPIDRITAIYARENGQGMAFSIFSRKPMDIAQKSQEMKPVLATVSKAVEDGDEPPPSKPRGDRPSLKRVK